MQYRTITEKDEYKKVKVSTRVKTRDASYDWKAPGDKFTSTNCQRYTGVEEQHGYFVFSTLCADGNDVYVYIPSNGSDINQIESEVGMYQDVPDVRRPEYSIRTATPSPTRTPSCCRSTRPRTPPSTPG